MEQPCSNSTIVMIFFNFKTILNVHPTCHSMLGIGVIKHLYNRC